MRVCILKQINVSGPEKDINGSIRIRRIYFPSGPDFLRSLVQSRLDMKEAVVGPVDPKSTPRDIRPTAHVFLRPPNLQLPLAGTQGHAGFLLLFWAFSMLEKITFQTCFLQSALRQPTSYPGRPTYLPPLWLRGCLSTGSRKFGLPFQNDYFKQ